MGGQTMRARFLVTNAVTAATVVLGMVLTPVPTIAMPVKGFTSIGYSDSDIVLVARKRPKPRKTVWHKTRRGEGQLLGRVEDIDRRERKAANRRGGKLVGRVPTKGRVQQNEELNQFVRNMLGTGSGGCGIDVTTPNPTGCGTYMGNGGGNNGLRPPYYCLVNGRRIVTNTFRSGCWMVSQENRIIPMP